MWMVLLVSHYSLAGHAVGAESSLQRLGDGGDVAVGLLVGLDQRHEQAGQCGAAAVENVRMPVLPSASL